MVTDDRLYTLVFIVLKIVTNYTPKKVSITNPIDSPYYPNKNWKCLHVKLRTEMTECFKDILVNSVSITCPVIVFKPVAMDGCWLFLLGNEVLIKLIMLTIYFIILDRFSDIDIFLWTVVNSFYLCRVTFKLKIITYVST